MKNKTRFISFMIVFFMIMTLLSACSSKNSVNEEKIETTVAILEEKEEISENEWDLIFNIKEDKVKLQTDDSETISKAIEDEIYSIAYDPSTNSLLSLSIFDFEYGKEPEIEYAKDEPEIGEEGNPIAIGEKFETDELTQVDSFEYSFSNSESVDTISLYTTAEMDEDGELLFDDGEQWTLLAETEDGDYILFDDYLSMGEITLKSFTHEDNFYIVMIQSDTANIELIEFLFDKESKTFIPSKEYQVKENANILY